MMKLSDLTFLYVDTEFIRRDLHGGKFTPNIHGSKNIELWTIQYSIFKLNEFKDDKLPKLEILTRWNSNNEKGLLSDFFPIYKRIALGTKAKTRLYPIGNMVYTDLEILCNKYNDYCKIFQERARKEGFFYSRNLFSRYHIVYSSRFFD